ncbi:MAG: GNAT family N-acetyltransferase [Parvibaculaceae bacterium]
MPDLASAADLSNWRGVSRPERSFLDGRYARLEPLDPARHGADLLASSQAPGADDRFRYLFEEPPADKTAFAAWLEKVAASTDPLFFAVIDKSSGRAEGRQTLMRIDPGHGVIEIGNILWGPAIARTRVATEALFLFARHVFDDLGYRRFEWKCNNLNEPSKRAALRFGFAFEGVFRQHMVVKGKNRDTAWFAMTDRDWPALRAGYQRWLDPANFDADGRQLTKLILS